MNEIDLSYFDLLSYQEHLLSGPVCTYKTSHNLSQALLVLEFERYKTNEKVSPGTQRRNSWDGYCISTDRSLHREQWPQEYIMNSELMN